MSSWYVWNAVGLYPNAGQDLYYIGSPVFTLPVIDLGGKRSLTVEAQDASPINRYVRSASLNGKPLKRAWLRHAEIAAGGILTLHMSSQPSGWASSERPPSSKDKLNPTQPPGINASCLIRGVYGPARNCKRRIKSPVVRSGFSVGEKSSIACRA